MNHELWLGASLHWRERFFFVFVFVSAFFGGEGEAYGNLHKQGFPRLADFGGRGLRDWRRSSDEWEDKREK